MNVDELGKKVKAKHRKYRHLSDREAGREAKYDYPHAYGDVEDIEDKPQVVYSLTGEVDTDANFKDLVKDLVGPSSTLVDNPQELDNRVRVLISQFNANRGWLSSFFAEPAAQRNANIARSFTSIETEVITHFMMLADRYREGKVKEIEFKLYAYENAYVIETIFGKLDRLREARKLNITEGTYTKLQEDKLIHNQSFAQEKERKIFEVDQLVRQTRLLSDITIDEQVEVAERLADIDIRKEEQKALIDWKRYKDESLLDAQLAVLANLEPIAHAAALMEHLEGINRKIETKMLSEGYAVQQDIKLLNQIKDKLEEAILMSHERLLQGDSRQKQKGLEES